MSSLRTRADDGHVYDVVLNDARTDKILTYQQDNVPVEVEQVPPQVRFAAKRRWPNAKEKE